MDMLWILLQLVYVALVVTESTLNGNIERPNTFNYYLNTSCIIPSTGSTQHRNCELRKQKVYLREQTNKMATEKYLGSLLVLEVICYCVVKRELESVAGTAGQDVTRQVVGSVHEVARCSNIHIRCNI